MESENKKEIGVADGKDLEWKFDVNITAVTSFSELICLIAMLHVIPNLNKKLGNNEKEFVNNVVNKFYYHFKKSDWNDIIENFKKNTRYSLTRNICKKAMMYSYQIPFEELSKVMKENDFTWSNIFDMIKKLDSYCYIIFTADFFDFKDLAPALQEKLKQEKAFGEFKENWKKNREATMTNNRKNWIKKVNLEGKKIIKSREDLKEIFTKIRECLDDGLFLYSNEEKIIRYELVYDHQGVFHFLWKYRDDENYSDMGNRKLVLELLVDLGFSFDYEEFIGYRNKSSKVIKAESEASNYGEKDICNRFSTLVQNFNKYRDLSECILWFDDKNKKIDFSMLGFKFENSGKIYPIDKKYERGFSEEDMSCVLDKFKNEKKGFCCAENMQFFVYMMENPCKPEYQIMKDEEKREQFYLDLMDVLAKSVGEDSISLRKIFNFVERPFTEQEENDFIKQNNLQGIKEKEAPTWYIDTDPNTNRSQYHEVTRKRKITLCKIEVTGYFLDIINQIPNDVFDDKDVKQKIKDVLWKMYVNANNNDKRKIFSFIYCVYGTYNLDLNKKDIETLLNQLGPMRVFDNVDSYWLQSTFNIIFKNRDKFSLDEKKKLLNEIMELDKHKGLRCLEIILDENIESESNKEIREKKRINQIKKIQKAVKKRVATHSNTIIKIQKVFRDFKKRKDAAIKLQTATRNFWAKRKLEKLKRQEKLKSLVQKKPETQEKIKKVILTNKLRRYLDQVKKLNLKERKDKAIKIQTATRKFLARKKFEKLKKNTIKIQKVFRGFSYRKKLKQRKKMTKICTWLFVGFVVSLVTFMFEMFVFDVAFLSIPSILTLLVAIILIARFLYIDHKFKIFFWKRKPPIENIIDPSIQKENLIFNDENNLITNQCIGTIPFDPNSITHPINITENDQNLNQKPSGAENIIDSSNQINLNEKNI